MTHIHPGIQMCLMFCFTAFKLRFVHALGVGLVGVGMFHWAGSGPLAFPPNAMISSAFFLTGSLFTGALTAWLLERYSRDAFLQQRENDRLIVRARDREAGGDRGQCVEDPFPRRREPRPSTAAACDRTAGRHSARSFSRCRIALARRQHSPCSAGNGRPVQQSARYLKARCRRCRGRDPAGLDRCTDDTTGGRSRACRAGEGHRTGAEWERAAGDVGPAPCWNVRSAI